MVYTEAPCSFIQLFPKTKIHSINNCVAQQHLQFSNQLQAKAGQKVQREIKHYLNEAAFNELLISREKPMIDFRKHHLIRQVRSKVEVQRWKSWRIDIRRPQERNRNIHIRLAAANMITNWCSCLPRESMPCQKESPHKFRSSSWKLLYIPTLCIWRQCKSSLFFSLLIKLPQYLEDLHWIP